MLIVKKFAPPPFVNEDNQIDYDDETDRCGDPDIQAVEF